MAARNLDSRLFARLDERVNLKRVYRQAEFVARTLTVSTFLEDAARMLLEWESQRVTLEIIGFSPGTITPLILMSFLVQLLGALSVISYTRPGIGCVVLLLWCVWHPLMYRQLGNLEFVAETLSIMGGLLILLSHLSLTIAQRRRLIDSLEASQVHRVEGRSKRLGLAGRVLLVSLFLYGGWTRSHRFLSNRVYSVFAIARWVTWTADGCLGAALLGVCVLVVLGMRSRFCALLMGIVNFTTNIYLHPFWIYLFSDRVYDLPEVMGSVGRGSYPMSAELYASHQRYFFFQSLSYTGALLLLVVHGPGQYSIDEPDPVELTSLTSKGRD